MNGLLKAAGSSNFTPKKGSKSYGTIAVDECKITGADTSPTGATVQTAATAPVATTASADADISFAPMPVPVQQFGNMSMGGGLPVPVPPPQKPTFVDYITGNCELSMVRMIAFMKTTHCFASLCYAVFY